jgi:hypothetical protein
MPAKNTAGPSFQTRHWRASSMQGTLALTRTRRSSSRSICFGNEPVATTAPRMPPSRTSTFEPKPSQWTGSPRGSAASAASRSTRLVGFTK